MLSNSTPRVIWVVGRTLVEAEDSRLALAPNCDARVFADGPSVLAQLAAAEPPDALVVDWQMPGMGGSELCQLIRQSRDADTLPIIVLTSTRHRDDLLAVRGAGANDYVVKPFDGEELAARVAIAVQTKRLGAVVRNTAAFRESFTGALGHDLRQPLSTLSMGTSVLLTRPLAEGDAKIVRRLHNATQRMTRMIADLFDLARAQLDGGIPVERRPLDFSEACREVVEEAQLANPARSIVLSTSGDGKGEWDRERVQQLCANLIGNALRHGEASAPIVVTVGGDADQVTLAVASKGPPLPDDVRANLLDPFRARDKEEPLGAIGLGLFIVRETVRAHGGSVQVDSNDVQTVFSVQLPRGEAAR